MNRRPFVGLAKPKLSYSLLPDLGAGPVEAVPPPKKATFLIPVLLDGNCLVKPGDEVRIGTRIKPREDSGAYAVSSVAGVVAEVTPYTDSTGGTHTAVTVEARGQEEEADGPGTEPGLTAARAWLENLPGGLCLAPFADPETSISTVVILGIDQDLLVTARQHVLKENADSLEAGVKALKAVTRAANILLLAPGNLSKAAGGAGCDVKKADTAYPGSLPRMVMHNLLGKTVPAGKSPENLGTAFVSVEAVVALGKAFATGRVPMEKVVTVIDRDEKAVNLKARIGTPIRDLLASRSIIANTGDRVVLGGPMRGTAVYSLDMPVFPDTDAVMVQDGDRLPEILDTPCVNCGDCVRACPARVPVNMLVRLLENALYEEAAERYDLLSCVECGLCAYVCPSHIPIFQYIMLGKHEVARALLEESA